MDFKPTYDWKKNLDGEEGKKKPVDSKKFFYFLIVFGVVLGVVIVAVIAALIPEKVIYSDLQVESVQVVREDRFDAPSNRTLTNISLILYMTNNGELESGDIQVDCYLKEYEGYNQIVASSENKTVMVDPVVTDKTTVFYINYTDIDLQDSDKYEIEILIMEDEKLVEEADSVLKLPYQQVSANPEMDSEDADSGYIGKSEEESQSLKDAAPGFESVVLLAATAAVMALLYIKGRPPSRAKWIGRR